jgi:trimeric autotransporter adhesin
LLPKDLADAGPTPILGEGTANYIPRWITKSSLGNSVIFQDPNNGNVGIGTATPVEALDVRGSLNVSGSYKIGGSTVIGNGAPGLRNLFVGVGAGAQNNIPAGFDNTFVGKAAGSENTVGHDNTSLGAEAGKNIIDGSFDTYSGSGAGGNPLASIGSFETASGFGAGNTDGNFITAFGVSAADFALSDSSRGTYFGYQVSATPPLEQQDNIYIVTEAVGPVEENTTIRIGAASQKAAYIAGIYKSVVSDASPVYVNVDGHLGTTRLGAEEQVRDMGDSSSALMQLRPVTFVYKPEFDGGERTLQYGLVAEEVAQIYPELVAYDDAGQPYAVQDQYLTSMLLNEVQKQYRRIATQAELLNAQEHRIQVQHWELETQRQHIKAQQAMIEDLQGCLLHLGY